MRVRSLALAALFLATPAFADAIEDRVAAELAAQGYVVVTMERTWFGRLRVVAEIGDQRREIVLNPVTGEILRDYSALIEPIEAPRPPSDRRSRDRDDADAVATVAGQGAPDPQADAASDKMATQQGLIPEPFAVEGD